MRYLFLIIALIPATINIPESITSDNFHEAKHENEIIGPSPAELAEIKCLATMIYGEARGEPALGQVAVAYSAINRLRGRKSLCDIVLAPKQYSVFNNNPELRAVALNLHLSPRQRNSVDEDSWDKAQYIANIVFHRQVPDPTYGSTHFIAPRLMKSRGYTFPRWARQYTMVAVIGNHQFFRAYYSRRR